jgi:hypothetical protein
MSRGRVLIVIPVVLMIVTAGAALVGHVSATPTTASRLTWEQRLEKVDGALASRDLPAAHEAVREAVYEAYAAALRSHAWEPLLRAADAQLRVDAASGFAGRGRERARVNYLAALFRAREQRSLDGVLLAAEAFARLGDDAVVQQALDVARELAGRDPAARERVDRAVTELGARVASANGASR